MMTYKPERNIFRILGNAGFPATGRLCQGTDFLGLMDATWPGILRNMSGKMVGFTFLLLWFSTALSAQKPVYNLNKSSVEIYDYQEVVLLLKKPDPKINPFKDASFSAVFTLVGASPIEVEGFCDAADGSVFKVRFMPAKAGVYTYTTRFVCKGKTEISNGTFVAVPSARKGPLRVDPAHPWHFIYENTGEHYFWNSTTTYWILGWKDEKIIREAVERLARYKINRIRVGIDARAHGGSRWSEPTVVESEKFTFKLNPWVAARPDDLDDPGFDVARFNLDHWQKLDRLVAHAREKGIVVSLIFYVDGLDHGCDPFKKANMGNEDEQAYYRFAAARYGAFENILWDVANEYHLFRTPEWAEKMGALLKKADHGKHLISVHGNAEFPFRKSPWVDVVMFQSWDECGGYEFMTQCRAKQAETGRILPQINEEYGYEGHYPPWGCGATASKTGRNRAYFAPNQRGIRLRRPLSALGLRCHSFQNRSRWSFRRQPPPFGLGNLYGGRLPNHRRNGRIRHGRRRRHGRRLDQRTRQRPNDHAEILRRLARHF
jgi:Protein of unknown function (DUF4038)/Domain of unknown function (DUF5060)